MRRRPAAAGSTRRPQLVTDRPALTADGVRVRHPTTWPRCATRRWLYVQAAVPVGGLPWAMALYGRDSADHLPPDAARSRPNSTADHAAHAGRCCQGGRLDDLRERGARQDPRRAAVRRVRPRSTSSPHALYYGAADTTPLFVILLDEYERWTGDVDLIHELRVIQARTALDWLDADYGDLTRRRLRLRYHPRNPARPESPTRRWRNSPDACGRPARPSCRRTRCATCELQGYAYDARIRGRPAGPRSSGATRATPTGWSADAARLRERFDRDFWLPERGYYALALHPGRRARRRASPRNIGHLLWTGIVDAGTRRLAGRRTCARPDAVFRLGRPHLRPSGRPPYNPLGRAHSARSGPGRTR